MIFKISGTHFLAKVALNSGKRKQKSGVAPIAPSFSDTLAMNTYLCFDGKQLFDPSITVVEIVEPGVDL